MSLLTKTIKVEVKENVSMLLETVDAFIEACNGISFFAQSEQIFNPHELQQHLYYELREEWKLRSQMTCSAIRQVASQYKHKKFAKQCQHRERGIFFHRRSMPLQRGRDWTLLPDGRVSLSTLQGRLKVTCKWGAFQRRHIDEGWKPTLARLVWSKGLLKLHITIEKAAPQLLPGKEVAGIDLGQNNLVAFAYKGVAAFFKGGFLKNIQRQYRRLYQSLQAQGTRGSQHKLRQVSGKQRRWQKQINHLVANMMIALALSCGVTCIALEDLSGIRPQTRPTRRQRADFHGWSFFQLRQFILYKAAAVGISVVLVNPYQTSITCPSCGHVAKSQREGHKFCCHQCSLQLNADLAAARNIAQRASA